MFLSVLLFHFISISRANDEPSEHETEHVELLPEREQMDIDDLGDSEAEVEQGANGDSAASDSHHEDGDEPNENGIDEDVVPLALRREQRQLQSAVIVVNRDEVPAARATLKRARRTQQDRGNARASKTAAAGAAQSAAAETARSTSGGSHNEEEPGGPACGTIRRAQEFVNTREFLTVSPERLEIQMRLLDDAYVKFQSAYSRFTSTKTCRSHRRQFSATYYGDMEEIYMSTRAAMMRQVEHLRRPPPPQFPSPVASTSGNARAESGAAELMRARVAEMEMQAALPRFDGDLLQWAAFREAFEHDVHRSEHLTPVQKLRKLQSAVSGMAEKILGPWPARPESYEPAWRSLCKAYEREYHTIHAIIREIHQAARVAKSDFDTYHTLLSTVRNARRHLLMIVSPTEAFDYMLMYELEARLDSAAREQWEMSNGELARPRLEHLEDFIERRARSSRAAALAGDEVALAARQAPVGGSNRQQSAAGAATPARAPTTISCRLCRTNHALYRCPEFLALSVPRRNELATQWRICLNCFRANHTTAHCRQGTCRRCPGQKHNSVLCPVANAGARGATASVAVAGTEEQPAEQRDD